MCAKRFFLRRFPPSGSVPSALGSRYEWTREDERGRRAFPRPLATFLCYARGRLRESVGRRVTERETSEGDVASRWRYVIYIRAAFLSFTNRDHEGVRRARTTRGSSRTSGNRKRRFPSVIVVTTHRAGDLSIRTLLSAAFLRSIDARSRFN